MARPADDGGLVARTYADRQNRFDAALQSQPQGMPLSVASPGNIVSVPPQDPAEQVTVTVARERGGITMGVGEPVTLVNDKGEPVTFVNNDGQPVTFVNDTKGVPRDEFAEAAAEAVLNPDPAVEQEIFDYGKKEIEPPEAGQPVNDKGERLIWSGEGEVTLPAEGEVAARSTARPKKAATRAKRAASQKKPERRSAMRDKKQVIQYSNIIIVALEEALDYEPGRHNNQPLPALYIDDDKYKSDIRELISELRRLNDLLERKSLRSAKRPAIKLAKHLDTFLGTYAKGMGWGASALTIGAVSALLYHLSPDIAGDIFRHLKGCR